MPHKVRGPRRHRLFINEANNIPYETFDQLEVRTDEEIWLDWNPVAAFWWHDDEGDRGAVSKREDADSCVLTYKDNEGLSQRIVQSIEMRKTNKSWWDVYGLGNLGEATGRIYTGWQIIDDIPHEARLERYGMDFGYTNDPTALVAIYRYNGGYILDEQIYQTGLSNRAIADMMANLPKALIIADSAEPKSIDELKEHGLNIMGSVKGGGSVAQGIQFVQDQRISVTKSSVNLIKEYRNYLWQTDKNGKITNTPTPVLDHAMDAVRYGMNNLNSLGIHSSKLSQFVKPNLFDKRGIPL